MPQARRTIRKFLHKCFQCHKMQAPPFARPIMPPLPPTRVRPAKPFEFVGLDFLGPTTTKQDGINVKAWILIICCMVTRGIYLEPTRDMSSISVINVLRRFISRRGKPRRILSDNAPTFVQIHKALDLLTGPPSETSPWDYTTKNGIRWEFIPAYAPWMGATYERLIGLVKKAIQRTIGRRILDYDDLCAFLSEVEASVNSRPITWVSDLPGAPLPLTPKDLIQNSGPNDLGVITCELDCDDEKLSGPEQLAAIWKAYREAADVFWDRWSQEYILAIRERAGWNHKAPKSQSKFLPSIGQIVLVEMDLRPRNLWPLAKIVKLNGSTNEIRSVDLLIGDGKIITRPISRLCPLETEIEESIKEIPKETSEIKQKVESLKNTTISDKTARTHKMILRNQKHPIKIKSTTTLMSLMVLALISLPVLSTDTLWYRCGQFDYSCLIGLSSIITALSVYRFECESCELQCSNRGVVVKSPIEIQKTAVCCMNNCIDHSNLKEYTYEVAHEILVNDYTCEAWFWANSQNSISRKIECPAVNECDLFNCYFCLEQLVNPTCNPRWAAFLLLLSIFILSSLVGILLTTIRSLHTIVYALTLILKMPFQLTRWILGKKWANIEVKRRLHRTELNIRERMRNINRQRRQFRYRLANVMLGAMTGILIVIPTSSVISITTQTESCLRGTKGLTCTINSATTLTLLPAGQTNTLLLRDEHGLTLGTITMRLLSLKMVCHQESIAWLRSYRVEPTAVKRCPRAGSCFNDHCENNYLVTHSVSRRQVSGATVVDCLHQLASTIDILRGQQAQMFMKCLHAQAGAQK
ncbi:unnamed protein product [Meloidogyne enterolobii]|uniref:Uncharacterized protein n=1 Tax=Meloidogyne enterolobii TaxID=390850 RepID=A0ACB0Z0G8_MELEN